MTTVRPVAVGPTDGGRSVRQATDATDLFAGLLTTAGRNPRDDVRPPDSTSPRPLTTRTGHQMRGTDLGGVNVARRARTTDSAAPGRHHVDGPEQHHQRGNDRVDAPDPTEDETTAPSADVTPDRPTDPPATAATQDSPPAAGTPQRLELLDAAMAAARVALPSDSWVTAPTDPTTSLTGPLASVTGSPLTIRHPADTAGSAGVGAGAGDAAGLGGVAGLAGVSGQGTAVVTGRGSVDNPGIAAQPPLVAGVAAAGSSATGSSATGSSESGSSESVAAGEPPAAPVPQVPPMGPGAPDDDMASTTAATANATRADRSGATTKKLSDHAGGPGAPAPSDMPAPGGVSDDAQATGRTGHVDGHPGGHADGSPGGSPGDQAGNHGGDRRDRGRDEAVPAASGAGDAGTRPTTTALAASAPGRSPANSPANSPASASASASDSPPASPPASASAAPPAAPTAGPTATGATPSAAVATPLTTAGAAPAGARAGSGSGVTGQVFPEVTRLVTRGDGTQRVTVKLAPEALGEVRIVLTVRRGEVQVRMSGSETAQRALLQSQSDLHHLLAGVGATASSVQIGDAAATLGTGPDSGRGDETRRDGSTPDRPAGSSGQAGADVRRNTTGQGSSDLGGNTGRGDRSSRDDVPAAPTGPVGRGPATSQAPSRQHSSRLDISV